MSEAETLGICHLDTAPLYGDGLAEKAIGRFLVGRRNRFVIATKYGLPENRLIEKLGAFGLPARALRSALRRAQRPSATKLPVLTASELRASVERSLQRLRTDWIDIVLLHSPQMARLSDPQAIALEFSKLRSEGLIRSFGIAGSHNDIADLLALPGLVEIIQTAESEWGASFVPDITYSAISAGPQSFFSKALPERLALERLEVALSRRPNGVVLVSTTSIEHLRELATACEGLR